MNETDTLLVDCHQEQLGVVGVCGLLHLEKGWSKCWPAKDDLEECDFGILWTHAGVLVEAFKNLAFPIGGGLLFDLKDIDILIGIGGIPVDFS